MQRARLGRCRAVVRPQPDRHRATSATPATITVFASGAIIHREQVNLQQGANHRALTLQAGSTGFRDFRVQVDPLSNDSFYQNNQLSTFSQVVGPPRVLLVSTTDDESQYLVQALQEQGIDRRSGATGRLARRRGGAGGLQQRHPRRRARDPAFQQPHDRRCKATCATSAAGWSSVGGPDAYGPGGYFQTPLEETLPVDMQIRDQKRLPQLTIAYVIDRSGSMSMVGSERRREHRTGERSDHPLA